MSPGAGVVARIEVLEKARMRRDPTQPLLRQLEPWLASPSRSLAEHRAAFTELVAVAEVPGPKAPRRADRSDPGGTRVVPPSGRR